MKQIIFCIGLILSGSNGIAQMTIAQIASDSDVVDFVKQQNYSKGAPQWNHFYLTDGMEWNNYFNLDTPQNVLTGLQGNVNSWKKVDINSDGKMDLVVSGYIARQPGDWTTAVFKVLVFLTTEKKNTYDKLNLLTDDIERFPAYFSTLSVGDKNLIQLFYSQNDNTVKNGRPYTVDTLRYYSFVKNFIDYTGNLYPKELQKIDYFVKDAMSDAYHRVTIEKRLDGKCFISYTIKDADSRNIESHTLKIRNSFFQSLDSLARQYTVNGNEITINDEDDTGITPVQTTIWYNDGSKKTIKDYGGINNYTLLAIYQTMEGAMRTAVNKIENRNEFWGELIGGVAGGLL